LGIAQALLNDPKILIVDEPTAGLDPEERVRFRNLLSDFAVNRTVILSTHIVGDIEFACERLAILRDGEISFAGKVKELVRMADGLVWGEDIDRREIDKVRNTYQVISYVSEGDRIRVRLISEERPGPKASRLEPTIEDAYMGLMGGII
ncbi:MAG: ABC transporter ATP-binding protein, partial [Halanaerobium sp.]|nr:ABC transporter ATP-binding protein [Halanaerobium sp.]